MGSGKGQQESEKQKARNKLSRKGEGEKGRWSKEGKDKGSKQ